MVVMPLHKDSPPLATTGPEVAADSQQQLFKGCWLVLIHLLQASNVVYHNSSRPRKPAKLTSAGRGSTLPLARMGLTPVLHAAGAIRQYASLHSQTQRTATAWGPMHMTPTSLLDTNQLYHSDTVG